MGIKENLRILKTNDNKNIAFWKVYNPEDSLKGNIFLTHGFFSNKKICMGIAKYFVKLGYTCWIMEWRNHGSSSKTKNDFDFETIGLYDIKIAFEYLTKTLHLKNINCIAHSGGGIALIIFLIRNQSFSDYINSITLFGCQSFGAVTSVKAYFKISLSKFFTYILGYVPAKKIGLGIHNEGYVIMKQWCNWNLKKEFIGRTNINYHNLMKLIRIPILSICAKGDNFIAPPKGCEEFFNEFNNENNKFVVCSKSNGFKENYNHGSIFLSRNAAEEVWGISLKWIEQNRK